MAAFLLFLTLQLCDFATTLVFLSQGVAEANPLVAAALGASHSVLGLAVVKVAGCGLAFAAWRSRRLRLLRVANLLFALCVVWNLAAIVAS